VEKMSEITLEKVDIIRERTGVTYSEAKNALEMCSGDVVDALIYLEADKENLEPYTYTTKDEFMNWIKGVIRKGNVTRIKIRKDEKVIVDIPVNAGIAVTGIAYLIATPLLALGVLSAVVAKVTIEITKEDGSVEVVNKIIRNTVDEAKGKFDGITEDMHIKEKIDELPIKKKIDELHLKDKIDGFTDEFKGKFSNISEELKNKVNAVSSEVKDKLNKKHKDDELDGNIYKYTVKFEEVKKQTDEEPEVTEETEKKEE
jgi:hypothetical protein